MSDLIGKDEPLLLSIADCDNVAIAIADIEDIVIKIYEIRNFENILAQFRLITTTGYESITIEDDAKGVVSFLLSRDLTQDATLLVNYCIEVAFLTKTGILDKSVAQFGNYVDSNITEYE